MRKQLRHNTILLGRSVMLLLLFLLAVLPVSAQTIGGNVYGGGEKGEVAGNSEVTIKSGSLGSLSGNESVGGNVYGGGNLGNLLGQTTVTLQGGNIFGGVFGGAQQANVGKTAFVHVDGANQLHDLTVNRIFGGNDISGHVGESMDGTETLRFTPEVNTTEKTIVNNTWQSYILTTKEKADSMNIFIGQMFGGGNGDYTYSTTANDNGDYEAKIGNQVIATSKTAFTPPTVGRTYMQVNGGTFGYVYAGGNAATVTKEAVISIDNSSTVTTKTDHLDITDINTLAQSYDPNKKGDPRMKSMGINISSFQYGRHFSRIFGGNNKADMSIMPVWNLASGSVFDLYSGGNEGNMISSNGILLEIPSSSTMDIVNAFGGCRKGDVRPQDKDGNVVTVSNPQGYNFPKELSARILVRGGTVQNVYGGNDIKGKVYGGTAVGVYTSISGDVYGGGNGSYAYTDNESLKDDVIWGDYYYNPGSNSVEALNANRPNVEQVSIRLFGEENKKTIIGGSVYVGGNSCTLVKGSKDKPTVELKVGSHVIADNVFLGNNGINMIDPLFLKRYASENVTDGNGVGGYDYSELDLKDATTFSKYMEGAASVLMPSITFDNLANGDPATYIDYSTQFGSLFCGGNVGSMIYGGCNTINFDSKLVVFDKLVGGCNNANIVAGDYNAAYKGGILGTSEETDYTGDRLVLNLNGLKMQPMRWKDANKSELVWNVYDGSGTAISVPEGTAQHKDYRLKGGNIYGGCYNSGHINGNVVINLNNTLVETDKVFDVVEEENGEPKLSEGGDYNITTRNSGVILHEQCMDALGTALNVFGGGYGTDSEVWGSATVNLNKGYTFQIYGGGENGVIGKADANGNYVYNSKYSTYVNLSGTYSGVQKGSANDHADMAECAVMYGGGFEGLVTGDTHVNLGNGRVYNSFGGSCNADILGHTETYIGQNGFPYARDHIYGGNDLGGKILGKANFTSRIRNNADKAQLTFNPENVTSYVEYTQGRVGHIFGGCYGNYDYTAYSASVSNKPYLHNAFVNFRPNSNVKNAVDKIFGAGEGYSGDRDGDKLQEHSYVLVDIPESNKYFTNTEVFGAGAYNGLGMNTKVEPGSEVATLNEVSAIIDLMHGQVGAAYGGSFMEGVTRRSVVNVPENSTIKIGSIFGGAYGNNIYKPCDVYEANVNYNSTSGDAYLICDSTSTGLTKGAIYGGNNAARRTLYGKININVPVRQKHYKYGMTTATVYGAGYGSNTWSEYTEINLNSGAKVWEVYGGGEAGGVMSAESVQKYYNNNPQSLSPEEWKAAWTLGGGYDPENISTGYSTNNYTNLENPLAREAEIDDRTNVAERNKKKYNTNVIINKGAYVGNYAYGGGLGKDGDTFVGSGDIYGTTYIALLGGVVNKDIYAAGTRGKVYNVFGADDYTASTTAYIEGGRARNVYGGGWRGAVGHHDTSTTATTGDILGETHVVIGKLDGTSYYDGIPAIQRNAYGGGEGGAVFGTANITLNNGYVGYVYEGNEYKEKLNDETWTSQNPTDSIGRLYDSGCVFGGGYIDNSSVDFTNVTMYGGHVRNSLFGGGEIAAIGRGSCTENGAIRTLEGIYKAGHTSVKLYDGNVYRNVFGGGRGYNNLGEGGTLYTDGYVFGQTEVDIYGGEVGADSTVAKGYGNVFGGGDIGYVYSAYENTDGSLGLGKKSGARYDDGDEGYYYKSTGGNYTLDGTEKVPTEDCKVLIEPWAKVTTATTIDETSYAVGEYVPTEKLSKLGNKTDTQWGSVDDKGIIIHNAVFAGGNTSSGSDRVYANTTTVFGNATASIHDVFNRDLITIGTGHTGGLYGDGNLTFIDGYRGLNITNYGTDYYSISKEITLDEYNALPARERAYYELRYRCVQACQDNEGNTYTVGSTITTDQLLTLFEGKTEILNGTTPNKAYWVENGVCSRYAGRIMNTIQRADFCGVFGSRMVMQGAQDRVPEIVDYTNYTINRVREVSLNKKTVNSTDHGNYFGIYNIVNYLGALTSDVDFHTAVRTTDNTNTDTYKPDSDGQTFAQWKKAHAKERKRNNGNSYNQVALASGVYLELTTEKSTGTGLNEKDWGYITGVVELDLINVQTGIGGGFVYAKNVHGKRSLTGKKHNTLTKLNENAVTKSAFSYTDYITSEDTQEEWETSGNFVHSTQTIIDDCYNISDRYKGATAVPAHYWYIKGQVYVYDQYISAYTGAPNAYSETVNIPLTITAASHGTMKLLDVRENLYTYYKTYNSNTQTALDDGGKVILNDVTYEKNTPISYWDYYMMSAAEKKLFVDKTYVTIADCKIGETEYKAGHVMLYDEYNQLKTQSGGTVYHNEKKQNVDFDYVFRSSNNLSHDTGYILTYDVNNPTDWNNWYTKVQSSDPRADKKNIDEYSGLSDSEKANYTDGPTYRLTSGDGGVFGQREYKVSNIISKSVYDTYQNIVKNHKSALTADSASFETAYIVTNELTAKNKQNTDQHLYPGAALAKSDYTEAQWTAISGSVAPAYVCTSTIQLSNTEFIYANSCMTEAEKTAYYNTYKDTDAELAAAIKDIIVPAYYCTADGLYGGNYYESGHNYRGLEAWCSMSDEDRQHFTFNYDALDLLIDPSYSKPTSCYDGTDTESDKVYTVTKPVDYTATNNGSTFTYTDANSTQHTITNGQELSRTEYEAIPNEQRHYAPIAVGDNKTAYVVKTAFQTGETPYAVGQTVSSTDYDALSSDQKANVTTLTFKNSGTYYYCRESYTKGENGEGVTPQNAEGVTGSITYTSGDVPVGVVISEASYGQLVNKQTNFTIHGIAPVETSTFYVSRNSDIFDLSTEKIITVIYQYDYEESDQNGTHITPVSERHVLNIHINFKSGIPTVEDISAPKIVLPGTSVSLRQPAVTPGAYEVTGGGWELFESESDAESHINGIEYTPNIDPLYLYQNGFNIAYYAQTYLGKTYSNTVKVSVANYHDLLKVMNAKDHHYYIDKTADNVYPKIYINDYTSENKNGLDLLKNLYDLSLITSGTPAGDLEGHALLDQKLKGGNNLEFFLRSDIDHSGSAWTPIANNTGECFEGTLHGDGYKITGLNNSLFNHLCGNVYNLGVTGSFTGAGIAEEGKGYMENCWTYSTNTAAKTTKPVFGNPTASSGTKQMVNCYYLEDADVVNPYTNHSGTYGIPTKKSLQAFYNGEVAYDLNGFYLYKRYCDNNTVSHDVDYRNYTINADNTLTLSDTKYYADKMDEALCSSGCNGIKYVEERFADGDFIYAGGEIPETTDERMYTDAEGGTHYYPIWPDDYIFFGQTLNYGHSTTREHQDLPSHINRSSSRLASADNSNRVYRAPAYFQNSQMQVAHFNSNAVFAKTKKDDADVVAYKNMTAIDFTGYQDVTGGYKLGTQTTGFYPPLLDDDGLSSFTNVDLTSNLLAYTMTDTDAGTLTNTVITNTLDDPTYNDYYTDNDYRKVAKYTDALRGHHVVKNSGSYTYTAPIDHFLVDKEDFNAPIAYTFESGKRMWYQRTPDTYVDTSKGWEGISIPFSAELVTTQDKGEITHFYKGSPTKEGSDAKIGHEYWLREYQGGAIDTQDSHVFKAVFNYPENGTSGDKTCNNTFLWDYYYSQNPSVVNEAGQDYNTDIYQTFYKTYRTYNSYGYNVAGKPYIIGFPGITYYEFDLSGEFVALHTYDAISRLGKQTVTFASNDGATINVSDDEMSAAANTDDGYTFTPNYLSKDIAIGAFAMKSDGSAYQKTTATTAAVPFRPYFTTSTSSASRRANNVQQITFSNTTGIDELEPTEGDYNGRLHIYAKQGKIYVESLYTTEVNVRILTVAGVTLNAFTIKPGETVETRVYGTGVYIVNGKKLRVEYR